MNNNLETDYKKNIFNTLYLYFIVIIILAPRGFVEYNATYQKIFTLGLWLSTVLIWIQFFLSFFKGIIRKSSIALFLYFFCAIGITFLVRVNVNTGFQKLFIYPSICLFFVCNMKKNPKKLLRIINNVFLVSFLINLLGFRSFFSQQYHITFLGHVQIVSQMGTLAVFVAVLYWLLYHEKMKKTIFLIGIAILTMLITDATAAVVSAIILLLFAFLYRLKIRGFLSWNYKVYLVIGILLNLFVILLSSINNLKYNNAVAFLDFSGRSFIWLDAISKIKSKFLLGYGIEGIMLDVFWNQWVNSSGFNYAHNQILQTFLDGGLILSIAFWVMIFGFCKNLKTIKNKKFLILCNAILCVYMLIMIFESISLYYYMFIFLSILYVLPDIIESSEKESFENGINSANTIAV